MYKKIYIKDERWIIISHFIDLPSIFLLLCLTNAWLFWIGARISIAIQCLFSYSDALNLLSVCLCGIHRNVHKHNSWIECLTIIWCSGLCLVNKKKSEQVFLYMYKSTNNQNPFIQKKKKRRSCSIEYIIIIFLVYVLVHVCACIFMYFIF